MVQSSNCELLSVDAHDVACVLVVCSLRRLRESLGGLCVLFIGDLQTFVFNNRANHSL